MYTARASLTEGNSFMGFSLSGGQHVLNLGQRWYESPERSPGASDFRALNALA
jgi:hypothetical protein